MHDKIILLSRPFSYTEAIILIISVQLSELFALSVFIQLTVENSRG